MRSLLLSAVLLGPRLAWSDDGAENILNDIFTAQHACDTLMPELDAAVSANPDGVEPLLARANCYYRVGRYGWVRRDVDAVFGGRGVGDAVQAAIADGASESAARDVVATGVAVSYTHLTLPTNREV